MKVASAASYTYHFTLLQTDNQASTSSVITQFLQAGCFSWRL